MMFINKTPFSKYKHSLTMLIRMMNMIRVMMNMMMMMLMNMININMNIMMMTMNLMMMKVCAYPCHDEEVIMMNSFPLRYIHCSK